MRKAYLKTMILWFMGIKFSHIDSQARLNGQ